MPVTMSAASLTLLAGCLAAASGSAVPAKTDRLSALQPQVSGDSLPVEVDVPAGVFNRSSVILPVKVDAPAGVSDRSGDILPVEMAADESVSLPSGAASDSARPGLTTLPSGAASDSARPGLTSLLERQVTLLGLGPNGKGRLNAIAAHLEMLKALLDALALELTAAKDMLTDGQAEILLAVNAIDADLDLSGLEAGQTQILADIAALETSLDTLSTDIQTAIDASEVAILAGQSALAAAIADVDSDLAAALATLSAGQTDIVSDISDLSDALDTAKDMIIDGQAEIVDDIADIATDIAAVMSAIADLSSDISDVSTQISDAQTAILAGQAVLSGEISDLSTQLTTAETNILDAISNIDIKIDTLLTGQDDICDKIDALDAKLDTIIDELSACPSGSVESDGMCFSLSATDESFADATTACAALAGGTGTLATMTAANEAVLYGLADMAPSDTAWIGLERTGGSWTWQDGSAYGAFTDWPGADPSNPGQACGQAAASSMTDGEWDDAACPSQAFYICQTDANNVRRR